MPKRLDVQKRRARALAGGDRGPADLIAHFFHFLNFGHTKGHAEPGGRSSAKVNLTTNSPSNFSSRGSFRPVTEARRSRILRTGR
jgi:hypothetical protein